MRAMMRCTRRMAMVKVVRLLYLVAPVCHGFITVKPYEMELAKVELHKKSN